MSGSRGLSCQAILIEKNLSMKAMETVRHEAKSGLYITWMYTHFPLVVGLCATAAGIRHLVSADQNTVLPYLDELLMCSSVALCLFSIGLYIFAFLT